MLGGCHRILQCGFLISPLDSLKIDILKNSRERSADHDRKVLEEVSKTCTYSSHIEQLSACKSSFCKRVCMFSPYVHACVCTVSDGGSFVLTRWSNPMISLPSLLLQSCTHPTPVLFRLSSELPSSGLYTSTLEYLTRLSACHYSQFRHNITNITAPQHP